jgi:hypothetical protein
MALIYLDSFDHYTSLADKAWSAASNATIQASQGRFSTAALRTVQSGSIEWVFPAALTTVGVGFAFRFDTAPTGNAVFLAFFDGATEHVRLELSPGRLIRATRAGTLLGTGTFRLDVNQTYYIECKVTIDDSTGVVVVKVNEITDINLSSQDTRNAGNASVDRIRPQTTSWVSGAASFFDDLVIWDTTGGAPTNDFLGDIRVEALFPNGNGNSSQWVGNDGNSTDNYLLVDETAPNSDTDYVESSTVGNKDTYAYGNLTPTTGTVYGVQINPFAKKTDAGARSIVSVARHSGSETDGPVKTLNSTYGYLPDIRETKPGGGAWSISDINAAEFGIKVNA